jgi:hypothetical protein
MQAPPHSATTPCTPFWRAASIKVSPSGALISRRPPPGSVNTILGIKSNL